MPHARKENVHAKPLKLLKPRAAPINTCVENDDWPRAKPGGRKRYQSADRKKWFGQILFGHPACKIDVYPDLSQLIYCPLFRQCYW